MRPADTLTLEANYSYIDAKDRTTGLTLLRRPKHSLNASFGCGRLKPLRA